MKYRLSVDLDTTDRTTANGLAVEIERRLKDLGDQILVRPLRQWVLLEVRGGSVQTEGNDGLAQLIVDWDNVGDSELYARDKLAELTELAEELPDEIVERVRDFIAEIWPTEEDE